MPNAEDQATNQATDHPALPALIGESEAFLTVMERISQLAPLKRPVLVVGERGTGKELVAARLHYLSERWNRQLVTLNCAALNEELLESELFGHVAGAFTGASKNRQGRFERAHRGSLFLDELHTMRLRLQEKLLRVLEYGQFDPVGSSETQTVDVRLIAATNTDLPSLGAQGLFREDLLDRLSFSVITLPPLRARGDDILLLAQRFGESMAAELGRAYFAGFSARVERELLAYAWPGNIRELRNVVQRAVSELGSSRQRVESVQFDPFESPFRPQGRAELPRSVQAAAPVLARDYESQVLALEKSLLEQALTDQQFNQKKAAEQLGLSYHALRGQLKKHGLLKA